MRRLRIAVAGLFVLSLIAFIAFNIVDRITADHTPPTITSESDTVSVTLKPEKDSDKESSDEESGGDSDDDAALYQGLTAEDNRDGDLTDSIRVSSMSNFTEPGKREITYAVFDSSNNSATLTRTLEYTDYTSPQIKLSAPLRYTLDEMSDVSLTENMSVEDCLDGDITSQIRASYNDAVYVQQAGDYPITVQVSNSAGDTCTVNLTVTVTDPSDENESQKYYPLLSQYIVYAKVGGSVDYDSLITGFEHNGAEYLFEEEDDDFMPGKRGDVDISGDVNFDKAGSYTVDYRFTPEDGVTATTKLVVVVG